ncbi:hypothetical protein J1605_009084 [Eschrichtius robustus]|uniref:Uncharacterized protein n=1 Tax=Eschrichtius robustus TaxID=9764 RepID=A0AB34GZ58_ESCRO|nr:hypothetical protein J1605_009084 [Eschrichtius robustus]
MQRNDSSSSSWISVVSGRWSTDAQPKKPAPLQRTSVTAIIYAVYLLLRATAHPSYATILVQLLVFSTLSPVYPPPGSARLRRKAVLAKASEELWPFQGCIWADHSVRLEQKWWGDVGRGVGGTGGRVTDGGEYMHHLLRLEHRAEEQFLEHWLNPRCKPHCDRNVVHPV